VSKWCIGVRLSANGCASFDLGNKLVESYDHELNGFRSECSHLERGHVHMRDRSWRCPEGYTDTHHFETCTAMYCQKYLGASSLLATQVDSDVLWTSGRGSGSPSAVWLAVAFSEPVEVDCIEVWQLRRGACPRMQVQSRDKNGIFSSWWEEKGWVYTEHPDPGALVARSFILPTPRDTNSMSSEALDTGSDGHKLAILAADKPTPMDTYEIGPGDARGSPVSALASTAFFVFALLGAASCLGALLLLLSLELWYEVDYKRAASEPKKATAKAVGPEANLYSSPSPESYGASRDTLIRVRLVCHPRWLLGDGSLADLVRRICPELRAAPTRGTRPLTRFEVVLSISGGEAAMEIGQVMQMVVERRRSECAASLVGQHRQPRFQLVASTRWAFLHFGGNIGCGKRRWRSCPARLSSGGNFPLSFSSRARTGSAHED